MQNINVASVCLDSLAGIAAAASHDLKNCLAVINETGGLLDDIAVMVEEGVPSERVRKGAQVISGQVAIADAIIKNLNSIAHSWDTPLATANLGIILARMVSLTSRKAASASIQVEIVNHEEIQITTQVLVLESLLFRILTGLYDTMQKESVVQVEAVQNNNLVTTRFICSGNICKITQNFWHEEEQLLARELFGTISIDKSGPVLTLPTKSI